MGGMQGFGPVERELSEPVFHARWEGRVLAMRRVLGAVGRIRPSGFRPALENLPQAEYLSNSYYQNWLAAFVAQLIDAGVATREEIESGEPAAKAPVMSLTPAEAATLPFHVPPAMIETEGVTWRFHAGQRVRARNIHPSTHTRLPRYVRGRLGVVQEPRGVQAFPDSNAYGRGVDPQAVYSVRFAARELWGEQAGAHDAIYVDLWDRYLDPA
jgi:nitrile hydratase